MSAVLGIVRWEGPPLADNALGRAMDTLAHYGDNGGRAWRSGGRVVLGHHLRTVTPESVGEEQPLVRGQLAITADVRLDNRTELAVELGFAAAELKTLSDSELILGAYRKWGEDCADHLLGDFAFAIWDGEQQRLYAARDHIGARPFYYWESAGGIAFASEIRGVLACDGVRTEIDEAEIARLLTSRTIYYDARHTFFKDLRKLPFGHWLTCERSGQRLGRHWRPEDAPEVRLHTLDDYAERLRELVTTAVSDRLRSRLPIGAHISGGLDSSSVAVITARLLRSRGAAAPAVFSHSPPPMGEDEGDEHRRISRICRQEGLEPVYVDPAIDEVDRVWAADASILPVTTMKREQWVQRSAASRGIGVLLTGWGGDEGVSFNGRGLGPGYFVNGQWRELAEFLGFFGRARAPWRLRSVVGEFYREVMVPLLAEEFPTRWGPTSGREAGFILPKFAHRMRRRSCPHSPRLRVSAGVRAYQLGLFHHGHLTARMESWAAFGAQHGITYGHPLTDRRLLEFCLSVPDHFYYLRGHMRCLYRYAMTPVLPSGVPWEGVKQDAALGRRLEQLEEEERRRMRDLLDFGTKGRHVRWIDLPRLARSVEALETGAARRSVAMINALTCLRIVGNTAATEKTCGESSSS